MVIPKKLKSWINAKGALLILMPFHCVLCLLFSGCTAEPSVDSKLRLIESDLSLALPDSSQILNFECQEMQVDPAWIARIEISSKEFDVFCKELENKKKDNTNVSGWRYRTASWWNPRNVHLEMQYLPDKNSICYIVLEKSPEADKALIFIEFFVW